MGEFRWNEKDAITFAYIMDMLKELRRLAVERDAQMLVYLLDIAAEEACELKAGKRSMTVPR